MIADTVELLDRGRPDHIKLWWIKDYSGAEPRVLLDGAVKLGAAVRIEECADYERLVNQRPAKVGKCPAREI